MKYSFLLILLCVAHITAFSQITINGNITDEDGSVVPAASVQLYVKETNKIVAFTTSDDKGNFIIKTENAGNYRLEVSHLSYEKEIKELSSLTAGVHSIKILVNYRADTVLEGVTIIGQASAARQKGDTISYNLKALTTGNEQKLKDVISRLPGLEINDNGKITSNGKVVNDLLINGQKMFGDNHQIATENINAEMLEGIDLLNNYENISAVKEIEGSDKTALNIQIKEEYLGRITGNADGFAAYEERYKLHSNLFRFGRKLNLSSIIDLNNMGEQALTLSDYLNMSKSIKQDLRNNDASLASFSTLPSIPDFLLQNENLKRRKSQFASFDIAYNPTERLSISGYSIFNFTQSDEAVWSEKRYLNTGNENLFRDNQLAKNKFFFNQTRINADYKAGKNALLNYSLIFDPNTIDRERNTNTESIDTTADFSENNNRAGLSFGHQFSYIQRIAKNKLLSFNAYQEIKRRDDDYGLTSSLPLFDLSVNDFFQSKNIRENEAGVYAKYTQKAGSHIIRLNTGYYENRNRFDIASQDENVRLNIGHTFADASLMKKTGFLQYRLKAEIRNSNIERNDQHKNILQFLPSAQLKLSFSETNNLTLSYNKTIDFPKIDNLNDFSLVNDFRNRILASAIPYSTPYIQHVFSVNYFRFNLYKGTVIMLNSSLISAENAITTGTFSHSQYNEMQYTLSPEYSSWNNNIGFEQRLSPIKSRLKINAAYLLSRNYNYINSLENQNTLSVYTLRTSLSSKFDVAYFNYDAGVFYSHQSSKYSIGNSQNTISRFSPMLNFNGRFMEHYRYFLYNSYENYRAGATERGFYNLGFKLIYSKEKSKLKYWIEGFNVLNMNNPEIVQMTTSHNMFATEILSRLSGYVGAGITIDF